MFSTMNSISSGTCLGSPESLSIRSSIKAKGKTSINNENKAETKLKRGKKYTTEERTTIKGTEKTVSPFGLPKKKKAGITSKMVEGNSRPSEMIMSLIVVSLF